MKSKIFFRTNAHNSKHLYKTIDLAQVLNTTFACCFIVDSGNDLLRAKIENTNNQIIQLPERFGLIEEAHFIAEKYLNNNTIMVLCGQQFRSVYQEVVKSTGSKLVCIDDNFQTQYRSDLVINDLALDKHRFFKLPSTQLCLGLDYLLLGECFWQANKQKNITQIEQDKDYTLIYMEEGSNELFILPLLRILINKTSQKRFKIFVGKNYRHHWALYDLCQKASLEVEVLVELKPEEKVMIMQGCQQAICQLGKPALEYLCVGGDLFLFQTSNTQDDLHNLLLDKGVAFLLTNFREISKAKRLKARSLQKELITPRIRNNLIGSFQSLAKKDSNEPILKEKQGLLLRA